MNGQPLCHASHPHPQKGWTSWRCPLCQNPLRLESLAPDADAGCKKLHSDDQLMCDNHECLFAGLGNFVARLVATHGLNHPCTCCNGKGHVGGLPCKACFARGYGQLRHRGNRTVFCG